MFVLAGGAAGAAGRSPQQLRTHKEKQLAQKEKLSSSPIRRGDMCPAPSGKLGQAGGGGAKWNSWGCAASYTMFTWG